LTRRGSAPGARGPVGPESGAKGGGTGRDRLVPAFARHLNSMWLLGYGRPGGQFTSALANGFITNESRGAGSHGMVSQTSRREALTDGWGGC